MRKFWYTSDPSFFEAEIIVEESKRYKSPNRPVDQVPAELVKAGGENYVLEIHESISAYSKIVMVLREIISKHIIVAGSTDYTD